MTRPLQSEQVLGSGDPTARDVRAVIAYHEILADRADDWYTVTLPTYREHLATVKQRGGLAITFDDGTLPEYEHAAAPLCEAGLRATYFVCAGRIGSDQFMSWDQLRELAAAGHRIESHGWSHRLLTHCDDKQLELELLHSRLEIESRIGAAVTEISMPGGRVDQRVIEACGRAGYKAVYTSDPWVNHRHRSGLQVRGRMMMTRDTKVATLEALACGAPLLLWKLRMKGTVRAAAKACVGDALYHQLWRKISGRAQAAQASSVQA